MSTTEQKTWWGIPSIWFRKLVRQNETVFLCKGGYLLAEKGLVSLVERHCPLYLVTLFYLAIWGVVMLKSTGGCQSFARTFLFSWIFSHTLGKLLTQFNQNLIVRDSFIFKHSIRIRQVSARMIHLFYVVFTFQPNETVLTVLEW